MILAQLDQRPLYNSINFGFQYSPGGAWQIGLSSLALVNTTAATTLLNSLICPSDPAPPSASPGVYGAAPTNLLNPASNYVASAGTTISFGCTWGPPPWGCSVDGASEGTMYAFRAIKFAEISDGLSNTLLIGEIGRGPTSAGANQSPWFAAWTNSVQRLASAGINQPFASIQPKPSCYVAANNDTPAFGAQNVLGFGSYHPGGANFLFCDGSVKFLRSSTNLTVLSALGTRAGGEVVSQDSY